MRCRYCFYHDVAENREIESYGFMSAETAHILIDRAFEAADNICFAFQGGEPTLHGIDFFRDFTDYVKSKKPPNKTVTYALQTNGLLINGEFAEFFRKNHFLVGLSLDGTKEIHDMNRIDAKKNGTFTRIKKAAELLEKNGVEFNILSVVTDASAKRAEANYNFYKQNNFRFLQYIPQIAPFDVEDSSIPSLSPENYGRFLCTLFDLWYRDFAAGNYISIRDFDNYCGMLMGKCHEICTMRGRCSCNLTVEANGNVYPCDFYVLDEYLLGNLHNNTVEEMVNSETAKKFIEQSNIEQEECASCKWRPLCRTGCRRYKEPLQRTGGYQYFCKSYKMFFEHCYDRMETVPEILNKLYR